MVIMAKNVILFTIVSSMLRDANTEPDSVTPPLLKQIANTDPRDSLSSIAAIFSPRMDFDQWKPLTGRGDPLRNDPTYDYEPPMLEKVHYWADDSRLEREHYPEQKSEVLMLGVSSRKPSVSSRPPIPPKRQNVLHPQKFEDYSYKYNEYYPMTILVPPPPPPVGYKPSLFITPENKVPRPTPPANLEASMPTRYTISTPELITSFALQEANLIYESTDGNQTWFTHFNNSQTVPSNTVSSDYAGWGPTTPFNERNIYNDFNNLIQHKEHSESFPQKSLVHTHPSSLFSKQQITTSSPTTIPTFVPTALPPVKQTITDFQETWPYYEQSSTETTTEPQINLDNVTDGPETTTVTHHTGTDMLGPMMSMPLVTDPERPEDNLYAHASENIQIFKEHTTDEMIELDVMQTMQPPPLAPHQTSTTPVHMPPHQVNVHRLNDLLQQTQSKHTHDPYLHMRFTTPLTPTTDELSHENKLTTESTPMYLIIQGHSKVKTYGSKPKPASNSISDSDITKQYETNEVKHLHPIKDKYSKLEPKESIRTGRSQNLTSLIDAGVGSIEIQEADLGIKYDVSDGSKVPVEIYRKGIVENDENNYSASKRQYVKRNKRQIDLSDLIPFDEETIEELVYNYLETKRNNTGVTGFIAKAITGDVSKAVKDALKEDDEDRSDEYR
ncbi:unnamed protein product [Leptosia nina]|uniref:Zonadhesin n=1 Tax=Leptosia nina TaxID=320188 RepID=A0AAV1IX29_9NEOP